MLTRLVLVVTALLGGATAATAERYRRAPFSLLALRYDRIASASNEGARMDSQTGAGPAVPPFQRVAATFVEFHSARVENDLMLFRPTLVGIAPMGRAPNTERFAVAPAKTPFRFLAPPAEAADGLEVRRDRDRLVLFRGPQSQGAAVAIGLSIFMATTISSAHVPRPFRLVFDGPVHIGPAIFDGGGMGAGIAGRL